MNILQNHDYAMCRKRRSEISSGYLLTVIILVAFLLPAIAYSVDVRHSLDPAISTSCTSKIKHAIALNNRSISEPVTTIRCDNTNRFRQTQTSATPTVLDLDVSQLSVAEQYEFYGLASYYNSVRILDVFGDKVSSFPQNDPVFLDANHLLAVAGRFSVQLFKAPGAIATVDGDHIRIAWPAGSPVELTLFLADKHKLMSINSAWSAIRYSHLWGWLASLSKTVEWSLVQIHDRLVDNWGWAIVIFAILLKILLLPVSLMTTYFQRQVSQYQAILAPQLLEIKSQYDGEQAHDRIMAAHKSLGITPFYTLRPMLGSLIQVPVLVAVFNALGEMPQLAGASFFWIGDLAYPDVIATLPNAIPAFGDKISLLPVLMTLITIFSTLIFQNRHASEAELGRQKRNLYLMATAFFVLFYPFPAAMVLYWVLNNILQTIQQQLIRI